MKRFEVHVDEIRFNYQSSLEAQVNGFSEDIRRVVERGLKGHVAVDGMGRYLKSVLWGA